MNESAEVKMAKIETRMESLGSSVEKGFRDIDQSLKGIYLKLEGISQTYLLKEEYYRDLKREREQRAPFIKTFMSVLTNMLSFISVGLLSAMLVSGDKIF